MSFFPQFTSPMVIRPKAKQRIYMMIALPVFLGIQAWLFLLSFDSLHIPGMLSSLAFAGLAVWHSYLFLCKAAADVTAFLPSTILICAVHILFRILNFIWDHLFPPANEGEILSLSVSDIVLLAAECVFWVLIAYTIIRAVCGKYKLVVPMILLFFGFFYTFIKYDLRNFVYIAAEIGILLLLWFPVDAVAFTSLYSGENDTK